MTKLKAAILFMARLISLSESKADIRVGRIIIAVLGVGHHGGVDVDAQVEAEAVSGLGNIIINSAGNRSGSQDNNAEQQRILNTDVGERITGLAGAEHGVTGNAVNIYGQLEPDARDDSGSPNNGNKGSSKIGSGGFGWRGGYGISRRCLISCG